MLPARRLRLLLGRALEGVPLAPSPSFELDGGLHDYLIKNYIQETATNEKLTDLLFSVSSLGIASQEDWLRLKKVCFAHLNDLSGRTVNKIFILLVEKNACGKIECVKLQEKLAESNFSKGLRDHECLRTLRCITIVGSRLSPSFIPHALESIKSLVKHCQTELLPTLSYTIGKLLTSKENKGIPIEVQNSILESLILRLKLIDYMLLSQSELIYLFWSLSTFCLPIADLRPMYLETSETVLTRGIQMTEVKKASPADLLLLASGLCSLLQLSGVGNITPSTQESGFIVGVAINYHDIREFPQGYLKRLLDVFDGVAFSFAQRVARGELQNRQITCLVLEMIVCSGATKVSKNAQILFHLLLRKLLYGEKDMWFCHLKNILVSEGENEYPLVNYFLFDQRVDFLDILTTRLSLPVPPSVSLRGFEKASIQEIIVVLEALVNGSISNRVQNFYLKGCLTKLPWFIRTVSRCDFPRIVHAVVKLNISEKTIVRAIQDRCLELGIKSEIECENDTQEGEMCKKLGQGRSINDWNSDVITLYICEKALKLHEPDKSCKYDVTELMENLTLRKGMSSATEMHCVSIVKSVAKQSLIFKDIKLFRPLLTSIYSRVKTKLPVCSMLSLILDGIRAGVCRAALLDSLSWVGSRLLEEDILTIHPRDVAWYFVAAHELDALDIASYPVLIGVFRKEKELDLLSPFLTSRLFVALCALGIDDKFLLEPMLDKVMLLCSELETKVVWTAEDWRSVFGLVHTLWTSSSEVVWKPLMRVTEKLVSSMIERKNYGEILGYLLFIASSVATFCIQNDDEQLSIKKIGGGLSSEHLSIFLMMVASLFSEDGITFSLARTDMLLRTESTTSNIIPQYNNIVSSLIIAHAIQRFAQRDVKSLKRLTPLGLSLWRYCLKHVEKMTITDNNKTLMSAVGFSIRFGASSQALDRFMSGLMEKEGNVNMLSVCSIVDGLLRTGKRRPVATQFVAHFSQSSYLDDLPATSLLSLLSFFVRDAERVSLGLTRANMLTALVWSSLSLKLMRLPETKRVWSLVELVPVESRSILLCFLCEGGLIENSSFLELVQPVSIVLNWRPNPRNNASVRKFLHKVKTSLDGRQGNEVQSNPALEEFLKKISVHT